MTQPETGQQVAGVDTSRPAIARVYDYWLGGKDNFAADREAGARLAGLYPPLVQLIGESRLFLAAAVHWAAERGVRQFLDLGAGLPTAQNTHQVARQADAACRVVYVDNDPMVIAHATALLACQGVAAIRADLTGPAAVIGHPVTRTVLDLDEPVCVVLAMVLHFVPADQARKIVAGYAELIAPGSYVVISCGSGDEDSGGLLVREYPAAAGTLYNHTPAQIRSWFSALDLIDPPGLVDARSWLPGTVVAPPAPGNGHILAGIGQVPDPPAGSQAPMVRQADR